MAVPSVRMRSFLVRALLVLTALCTTATVVAPPAAASLPARTSLETHIAYVIRNLINTERSWHHLPALTMSSQLMYSARRHDVTMAHYNRMSHQCPGEPWFGTRIWQAGYHWSYAGENIAWNSWMTQAGVVALQQMMYNERAPYNSHRIEILSSHFRDVGVDVYFDKTHHKVWLTTDFGRRR